MLGSWILLPCSKKLSPSIIIIKSVKIFDMNILLINGPNLNLLGSREAKLYGNTPLTDVEKNLESIAKSNGCNLETMQSNAEHELIDAIHRSITKDIKAIIINPAAYTHTSIALRDALLSANIPFYEVHISDVQSREEFRKFSYFSDIAEKVFSGLGIKGYELALLEAISKYKEA